MTRLTLLFAIVPTFVADAVCAQAPVFFRGDEITKEHIIYGSVDTVEDSTVTINLGQAHGVLVGDRFAIVRHTVDRALPVGRIEVILTKPSYSIARFTGDLTVQVADLALIRAENLNLWEGGISRSDRLLIDTVTRIESGADYDTRDITPRLLDELARDDEALRLSRQSPSAFLTEEEVAPVTVRDADVAGTFRPLVSVQETGDLRAPESRLAYGGSSNMEDDLAMMLIDLRAQRLTMLMRENIELGGMPDLDTANVALIEQRLAMLVRQTRAMLVGDAPPPEPEPMPMEETARAAP
jgi:hypothetical protein